MSFRFPKSMVADISGQASLNFVNSLSPGDLDVAPVAPMVANLPTSSATWLKH